MALGVTYLGPERRALFLCSWRRASSSHAVAYRQLSGAGLRRTRISIVEIGGEARRQSSRQINDRKSHQDSGKLQDPVETRDRRSVNQVDRRGLDTWAEGDPCVESLAALSTPLGVAYLAKRACWNWNGLVLARELIKITGRACKKERQHPVDEWQ